MANRLSSAKLNIALLSLIITAGCSSGDGSGLDESGAPINGNVDASTDEPVTTLGGGGENPQIVSSFGEIQDTIFTPICAECHNAAAPSAGLRLDEAGSFAALVGVASSEVPELSRVQVGDPDNSYLVQKIEGTAAVGARMPLGGAPLPDASINLIRDWISDGALPETTTAAALAPRVVSASIDNDANLDSLPQSISIVWSSEIDRTSFDDATVTLVASGGDSSFVDGNEVSFTMRLADSASGFVTQFVTDGTDIANDDYELRVIGSGDIHARARSAEPIDGDGNGVAGGDFVRVFTIDES